MPSYTLEIEAFGVYTTNAPTLEIWEDGVLDSSHTILSTGTSILLTINYPGALPSSLAFTFNDGFAAAGRTIEIQSVKINDRYVNTNNYLSSDSLSKSQSATVDIVNSSFLFDAAEPTAGDFLPSTQTFTAGNDTYRDFNGSGDQAFDLLAGRDNAFLGSGNDAVNGGAGNDYIRGGNGNDLLYGAGDNDRLFGENGDDLLYGGTGNDIIFGGNDNDEIHGNDGDDKLHGQNGDDIITGGAGNDVITGGNGVNYLFGDAGDDQIIGGHDADTIDGGDDNDIIYGGSGDDILEGGSGDDIIVGDTGNDRLDGNDGADILNGRADDDELNGGDGNDILTGENGDDLLNGDGDDDVLVGGDGEDTLYGGTGNDILHGSGLTATEIGLILQANPGVVFNAQTNSFYEFVSGPVSWSAARTAAAGNTINGVAGHLVTITSQAENDQVYALGVANGTDNSTGGSGNRIWLSANDVAADQQWVWEDGIEAGLLFSQGSTAVNNMYENWGTGQPNNSGGAQVYGTMWFNGGGNDDAWDDRNASDGHNYVVEWEAGLLSDDLAIDTLYGGDGNDFLYGYGGNDDLSGGNGNDVLFGGDGDDRLLGDDGDDAIYGGAGNDLIVGGLGNDFIDGGDGNDTIVGIEGTIIDITTLQSYGGSQDVGGTVTFEGNGVTLDGNLWKKFDVDYTITANTVIEFDFRSTLIGEVQSIGFDTDNTINNPELYFQIYGTQDGGGSGNRDFDNYDGSGNWIHYKIDIGSYYTGFFDFLTISNDHDSGSPKGNSSWANIIIYEDNAADTSADILNGGAGDDSISGNNGDNILYGGDGLDTLIGYGGADTFVFENASAFNDIDIVADFSLGDNDALDLSDLLTGYNAGTDNITDFVQILTDGADSDVYVDVTGSASFGAGTQIATLTGVTGLTDEATLESNGNIIA